MLPGCSISPTQHLLRKNSPRLRLETSHFNQRLSSATSPRTAGAAAAQPAGPTRRPRRAGEPSPRGRPGGLRGTGAGAAPARRTRTHIFLHVFRLHGLVGGVRGVERAKDQPARRTYPSALRAVPHRQLPQPAAAGSAPEAPGGTPVARDGPTGGARPPPTRGTALGPRQPARARRSAATAACATALPPPPPFTGRWVPRGTTGGTTAAPLRAAAATSPRALLPGPGPARRPAHPSAPAAPHSHHEAGDDPGDHGGAGRARAAAGESAAAGGGS